MRAHGFSASPRACVSHTHTHTEASGLLSCTQFNRHSHTLAALLRLAHSYQLLKNVRLQEREVSRIKSSTKHPLLASLLSPSDKGCAQNHPSRVFPARDGLYLCSSSSKPLRSHCVIYLQAVYERWQMSAIGLRITHKLLHLAKKSKPKRLGCLFLLR